MTDAAGPRLLLAAGGTGGHIMPAVATAEALRELAPDVQIDFVCGHRPSEWQIYRRLGIEPWTLPLTFNRPGLMNRMRFLREFLAALREARQRLRAHPCDLVVGFGSYMSVPPVLAARLAGIPAVVVEQDLRPGMANRLLAPLARKVAAAFETSAGFPRGKTTVVGNPIRADIIRPVDRVEARRFFRLSPHRLVCFCVGGSQGARGINQLLLDLLRRQHAGGEETAGAAAQWQLLWSTGPAHFDHVVRALREMGVDPAEHSINPYIDKMALAYAAADLVLCRTGALTLAELTAVGRPAILVPLPSAAGGHQAANARRLVEAGAAELILETDPAAAERLETLLARWVEQPGWLAEMAHAARKLGRPHAARDLARMLLDCLPSRGD
ncbi:MAG TPA: undecaprenyldiphospho-muramoylpentapeptide beta-N-acetylglucosaminyltransferase [Candidatus Sumerlaeota bacterium]|nr:undecaprenyldiphospho-muramoylpentapeptide beta-N-acetylglucosaminyltransferase [Candidatus Sumerlaeota bacterium]HPK02113.1 undecaprenyldiphospho-muramoylpentapeptide beta-N-acetylglucosaminyltransferase [Candidatus Sumerlaeota bacterium]